ncbi:ribosome maturation factor RimP [Rickettsiales endosymbiont of Stachyamoeba lipophora]|uniref:ribosome maturation factor RimP n=1 Tax=Rickettsiales endosymbiont of Stachyamoeba lipophora TaxID=2486578 RepID=UPI000F649A18|nr:ribosome maturation factor RimP [Rickettsiales endosymbiont of Stachyamoeba lipophora]AZL15958.1 ribosome maturation factor RimP [Rickettsiales endosymbiont of Stachyamoeba lipophora]
MIEDKIIGIIATPLELEGYEIYRIKFFEYKNRNTLQIMLERKDGQAVTIDDCEKASNLVSVLLDVEDPIEAEYHLEVSSPGIDRPLLKPEHYKKFIGQRVKLQTVVPVNNSRKFVGDIIEVKENIITIKCGKETLDIEYSNIASGNLVLTDRLIKLMQQ